MEGYKLKIGDYETALPGNPPERYPVRRALVTILTSPQLEAHAEHLLRNHALAMRIVEEPADTILLDPEEYGRICGSRDVIKGFSFEDAELLQRIRDAEKVELQEKERAS